MCITRLRTINLVHFHNFKFLLNSCLWLFTLFVYYSYRSLEKGESWQVFKNKNGFSSLKLLLISCYLQCFPAFHVSVSIPFPVFSVGLVFRWKWILVLAIIWRFFSNNCEVSSKFVPLLSSALSRNSTCKSKMQLS